MHSRAPRRSGGTTERSLGVLFHELTGELGLLVRQELALGRTEVRAGVRRRLRDAAGVAVGLAAAAVGFLALTAGVVVLSGQLLGSYWLAALIVGLVYVLAGGVGARSAAAALGRLSLAPGRTIESLQRTGAWARREAVDARAALFAGSPARGDGRGAAPVNRLAAPPSLERPRNSPAERPPLPRDERRETATREGSKRPSAGLLKRTFREVGEDDITGQAAKLAYYTFMAMPPALMAVFALTGLFGGTETSDWITSQLQQVLPADAFGLIQRFVNEVVNANAPGPLSIGLALAIWSASSVFTGLAATLNVAYDVRETRPFWKLRAVAVAMTVAFLVLLFGSSALLLSGPAIAHALRLGGLGVVLWEVLKWPLAFAFVVAAFWMAYYFLPNRDQSRARGTLVKASAAATAVWVLATVAFRVYVANFSSYSSSYGFLGAFILLLLWMYVTGLAVLLGGELASEMEAGSVEP